MEAPTTHRPIAVIAAEIATLSAELQTTLAHLAHQQSRRDKRRWRQKRYRERMKKKRNEMTEMPQIGHEKRNGASLWRGITHLDMPGKNPDAQKMNLSLLRLRKAPRLQSCYDLHGDALKAELARIKGINRDKSLRAMEPKGSAPPGER